MIGANEVLTLGALRKMSHNEIILWGDNEGLPGLEGRRIRWIAFAEAGMWRIRYGGAEHDSWWIIKNGNVLGMPGEIRRLVPCDDDAFGFYRF